MYIIRHIFVFTLTFFLYHSSATTVGINQRSFTINGQKTFLYGISAFDLIHLKKSDLLWIKDHGFNLVRVGVHWPFNNKSLMSSNGRFSNTCLNQYAEYTRSCEDFLREIVAFGNDLGIVFDLTVFDYSNSIDFKEAAKSIALITLSMPNVIVDLINEHNVRPPKSHSDIKDWSQEFKRINSHTVVFASNTHFIDKNENVDSVGIKEEGFMDILAPHLYRSSDWADKIPQRISKLFQVTNKGMYLQEEHRRGWKDADFLAATLIKAAKNAKLSGAAGYVFHQDALFDGSPVTCLKHGIDKEELKAIDSLKKGF